jgi:hypothetical protein
MDLSKILEHKNLFSFRLTRPILDAHQFDMVKKGISEITANFIINLCRLSTAEFKLLEYIGQKVNLLHPLVIIETFPFHAICALAKTDTTIFSPCEIQDRLTREGTLKDLSFRDFLLFSGDIDKILTIWGMVKPQDFSQMLLQNPREVVDGMAKKYNEGYWMGGNIVETGVLYLQGLIWLLKLDLCLGKKEDIVIQDLDSFTGFFPK